MTAGKRFDQPLVRIRSLWTPLPTVGTQEWLGQLVTDQRRLWSVGPAQHGSEPRPVRLGHELSELARGLHHADAPDDILREAVQAAIDLVPGRRPVP
jgi:hypothetical protein